MMNSKLDCLVIMIKLLILVVKVTYEVVSALSVVYVSWSICETNSTYTIPLINKCKLFIYIWYMQTMNAIALIVSILKGYYNLQTIKTVFEVIWKQDDH